MSTIMYQIAIFIFKFFEVLMLSTAVFCLCKRKWLASPPTSNESSEDAKKQEDVARKRFHLVIGAIASFIVAVICYAGAASLAKALETIAQS